MPEDTPAHTADPVVTRSFLADILVLAAWACFAAGSLGALAGAMAGWLDEVVAAGLFLSALLSALALAGLASALRLLVRIVAKTEA